MEAGTLRTHLAFVFRVLRDVLSNYSYGWMKHEALQFGAIGSLLIGVPSFRFHNEGFHPHLPPEPSGS